MPGRSTPARRPALAAALVALSSMLARSPTALAGDCAALDGQRIDDTDLHSSTLVAAADGLPGYCRVLGTIRPAIRFEVRLPAAGWNGKFYMTGCGGFCGTLDSDRPGITNAINHGLKRGYAVATMDGGHWGASVTDGRWAWNNRLAEADWGWRAVTETARVGKLLLREYYARPHARAYFAGCSTGGRMALMEATRFPQDFDGIIAGAPAMDYPALVGSALAWLIQANTRADGSEILARSKVPMIAAAVTEACDAIDGLRDGLIDDPRACHWQPRSLQCTAAEAPTCLTPDEVGVLDRWYRPAQDASGRPLYPGGIPRGSERFWPIWVSGLPGTQAPSLMRLFARDFLRYMAFEDDAGEHYESTQFDFERDPARLAAMARIYNSDTSELAAFRDRGGKLILYHGWADPLVTPLKTVEYYESLQTRSGGPAATQSFARLFMLPGFDHCGIQRGAGTDDAGFDPLPALEAWVERGEAPQAIETVRRDTAGVVEWRRPACPYPQLARPTTTADAGRFACIAPAAQER